MRVIEKVRYWLRGRRWDARTRDWLFRTTDGHCSFCDNAAHLLETMWGSVCRDCYAREVWAEDHHRPPAAPERSPRDEASEKQGGE